jgi:predicted amidohydrolase
MTASLTIALASPRVAGSLDDGIATADRLAAEASENGAAIVCFPEAWLPGLRGQDFDVLPWDATIEAQAIALVRQVARRHRIAIILSHESIVAAGRRIVATVIDNDGTVQGTQAKNQLDPTEDRFYVPGESRRVFQVNGVTFGVVTCHEGWRYPETVRFAATRGAKVVFHPQLTGYATAGVSLGEWGAPANPYYEKAMMMRSIENGIWFASVNYAVPFQEAATSIIDPSGRCAAHLPYNQEGVLCHTIDLDAATGHLARRYAPQRFVEDPS